MKEIKIVCCVCLAVFFGWVGLSSAQEIVGGADAPSANPLGQTINQISCFDFYKFQSVQVSLGADKDVYNPGEKVKFQGELINENSYPVVDGYVFARIGRKNAGYIQEGHFTIDEIIPLEDISLDANEKKAVSFDWLIPEGITGGDYRIDFFFSVGKKFNLGGLPFTNEVVIGGADFTVNSGNTSYVSFDKAGTKVNGEKYNHIGSWPQIDPGAKAEISQPLKNTFSKEQKASIQYDLYFWDSLNEKDKITSKSEEITVPANSSANLTYVVPEMKDSVYLLKITATAQNQKSITNIRLTSNQNHPRLNYPAITKFPLLKGDTATIFSCFHNTTGASTTGKMSVALEDKTGKRIGAMEYDGNISGAMMADKKDMSVEENYFWVKLIATLKDKDGKVMDQYEAVYDCEKINSTSCKELLAGLSQEAAGKKGDGNSAKKTIIIFVAMLSIIGLALIYKHKKGKIEYTNIGMLIFLVIGGFCLFSVPEAGAYNAKTSTSSYSINTGTWTFGGFSQTWISLQGNTSVLHKVDMVSGGYNVKVGDGIGFAYSPEMPFFNSAGSFWDSPYGEWCSEFSSKPCGGTWQIFYDEAVSYDFSSTINAIKPDVIISSSNPAVAKCTGMNCVAVGQGTAILTANISSTDAKLWARLHMDATVDPDTGKIIRPEQNYYDSKDFSFPTAALAWNITVTDNPVSIAGACGPAAKAYAATDLAFSGAFCLAGTQSPLAISFPAQGASVSWQCQGQGGGANVNCSASRANVDPPVCAGSPSGTMCFEDRDGIGPGTWHRATPTAAAQSDCTSAKCEYYIPGFIPPPQDPVPPSEGWKEVAP